MGESWLWIKQGFKIVHSQNHFLKEFHKHMIIFCMGNNRPNDIADTEQNTFPSISTAAYQRQQICLLVA